MFHVKGVSQPKTGLNQMANNTLNDLMRLKESGPDRKDFDFKKALSVWKNEKKRKLYQR